MRELDYAGVEKVLVSFIRQSIHKAGLQRGIVGVSGGLDSAVVLALTQKAMGSEHTLGLFLPYRLTAAESAAHAEAICKKLAAPLEVIDISPQIDLYFSARPTTERVLLGNKCARERMSILYDYSARRQALVVGTSNKSELLVGYSTLWGDSAAAFHPLGDLYKTQVFALAERLDIPQEIRAKQPSADLWPGQTDEGEIGICYLELDEILFRLVDKRHTPQEIVAAGTPAATVEKVLRLIRQSQYKRTLPPIPKLQARTIGLDFRYLRDWDK